MKRSVLCLLAAFFVASGGAVAASSGETEIMASGTGTVWVAPDVGNVNATIDTNAPTATDALDKNNQAYDYVVAALRGLGIARTDIALRSYNVSYNPPPRVMPPAPTGERYGYTVSRSFAVKVRDIGKTGTVTDACIGAGATAINNVGFTLGDPDAWRPQAIAAAVLVARKNAEMVARAASLHIVGIKSIEILGASYPGPGGQMIARATAKNSAFDQGSIDVEATVTVIYLAQPSP